MTDGGGLEFAILGPLEARTAGAPLALGGAQPRAVLALLLLERGRTLSTDTLIERLWPEQLPLRPQTAVQGCVSHLRKLLGADAILTDGGGYRLPLEDGQLDADRFERLVARGRELSRAGVPAEGAVELAGALALWRGSPLADFTYESWAQAEIARLEELRVASLEERIECELACGRAPELVGELETLVAAYPLNERFRGQLMLALYRSGRQAEALEAFQAARRLLVDELGLDPGPELRELERRILEQDPALASVAVQAAPAAPVRLPAPPTPLFGRDDELDRLAELVEREDVRLVTLTGPGGIGKTRLALAGAERIATSFPGGVHWIALQALRHPALVLPTIGQALEATEVAAAIGDKAVLLVLDNFEQVIDAATVVSDLLSACPRLVILVTSREPLHLRAEHEWPVPPLDERAAAELFAERAQAARPDFVAAAEAGAICRRLEGLPLAIELAAAHVRSLTQPAILERLEHRLDLLRDGPRDLPERQRTLHATIAWSHDLLEPADKQLFGRLSVFAGGWTAEAAGSVCDATPETLSSLVEKSLLVRQDGRYSMLETIREFAAELLCADADATEIHRAHAEHCAAFVESELPEVRQGHLASVGVEDGNVRAALAWARGADPALTLRLVSSLLQYWYMRGAFAEARDWFQVAIDVAETPAQRARAYEGAATFAAVQGDVELARAHGDRFLTLAREVGDEETEARALRALGTIAMNAREFEAAAEYHFEARELFGRLGDRRMFASETMNLGATALEAGAHDEARRWLDEALVLSREVGNQYGVATTLYHQGLSAVLASEPERARAPLTEAIELTTRLGHEAMTAWCLNGLAAVAVAEAEPERAALLLGRFEALIESVGAWAPGQESDLHDETMHAVREALPEPVFSAAIERGRMMTVDEALVETLVLSRHE